MKLVVARAWPDNTNPKELRLRVHLDETKVLEDGSPDPEWCQALTWGYTPNAGESKAAFLARMKGEAKALCLLKLVQLQGAGAASDGTALAGEGAAF